MQFISHLLLKEVYIQEYISVLVYVYVMTNNKLFNTNYNKLVI